MRIAKIPTVFKVNEIKGNALFEMLADAANNATPTSSGSGDAITNPAITGNRKNFG